jgi:hypothetical protein
MGGSQKSEGRSRNPALPDLEARSRDQPHHHTPPTYPLITPTESIEVTKATSIKKKVSFLPYG